MKQFDELIANITSFKVDYNQNRNNPAEVFESLAKVVDSFYRLDQCLLQVFHKDIIVKYEIESLVLPLDHNVQMLAGLPVRELPNIMTVSR